MNEMEVLKIIWQAKQTKRTILNLSDKNIKQLPVEIGELTNLKTLSISRNQISSLPVEIGQLENLTTLSLSRNQLKELPPQIKRLKNLETLDVSNNRLSSLPTEIGQLTKLKSLYLNENQLIGLPTEIKELINLKHFDISSNKIRELPQEIGNFHVLSSLSLNNNPIQNPPQEIIAQGVDAIKQFLSYKNNIVFSEVKMLIVGDRGVGKTSLKNRLIFNKFNEYEPSTPVIDIQPWALDFINHVTEKIALNVWDFGRKAIYGRIFQLFFTSNPIYLLILDAQQRESFSHLSYWLNSFSTFAKKSPILLVVNKTEENVYYEELKGVAEFPHIIYRRFETSCKEPPSGIKWLIENISKVIDAFPCVKKPWPSNWLKVRTSLDNLTNEIISFSEFKKLCHNYNVENDEMTILSQYLHNLGLIFHFRDIPYLHDKIVLKMKWLIQAVYAILHSEIILKNNGVLYFKNLKEILENFDIQEDNYPTIIALIKHFELIFQIDEKGDSYLIPELLPPKIKNYLWECKDNLKIEYHYDFLPEGIFYRFIAQMNKYIIIKDSELQCWKEGVFLKKDTTQAFVKLVPKKNKIVIMTKGEEVANFLWRICDQFELINKGNMKKMVPCECTKDCTHRFEFQILNDIKKEYKHNKRDDDIVICPEKNTEVSVMELLDGVRPTSFLREEKWTVFISYSSEDIKTIHQIAEKLTNENISFWFDKLILKPGDIFPEVIDNGIRNSKCFLACYGKSYLESGWCRAEYNAALVKIINDKSNKKKILPLIVDDLDPEKLPSLISPYEWVRYSDKDGISKLIKVLKIADEDKD